jgi:hypothetical protein
MANPTAKDMLEAINTCLKLDEDFELTEWEENFVISVEDRVKKGQTLSEKQLTALETIYDRT